MKQGVYQSMNTWPNNKKRAMTQSEHKRWNDFNRPGTRQLCVLCGAETKRCENDALYAEGKKSTGPLCEDCYFDHCNEIMANDCLWSPGDE